MASNSKEMVLLVSYSVARVRGEIRGPSGGWVRTTGLAPTTTDVHGYQIGDMIRRGKREDKSVVQTQNTRTSVQQERAQPPNEWNGIIGDYVHGTFDLITLWVYYGW